MIALSNLKKNLKRFQQIFRVEEMKKKRLRKKHSLRFNNLEFKKWKSFFHSRQKKQKREKLKTEREIKITRIENKIHPLVVDNPNKKESKT